MAHERRTPPLVKAKLSPPQVDDVCLRPQTLELLRSAFLHRVTMVCAPAGYGKTTTVLDAVRRLGLRHIWYKLDVLDHDPAALIASLVEALAGLYAGFGQTILDRLANAHDAPYPIAQMTAEFVAETTERVTDDLVLVLDDYHEASPSRDLNTALDYLVANLPPTVRFAILSRYEPAFEVGRLRLEGELVVVGVEDLRFGPDEVREVVRRRTDTTLSAEHAGALAELTEGWPASVVLAALAARWTEVESLENALSDPRLSQDVFSYLAEQVYSRESEEVRAFLRRTCCLEHLSVDLAKRVGAPRRAHRILDHLRGNGVFTFATAQAGAYRYHSLFREFLRWKVIQEDGPDRFHKLQLATAEALEAYGDAERAVELCLAANEPRCALGVISRVGATDLDAFRSDTLESWTARLPSEMQRGEPWAHLMAGEVEMRAGRFDAALRHVDRAVALLEAKRDRSTVYRALSARERTLFWKGDMTEAEQACRRALEFADEVGQRVHTLISLGAALNAECRWPEATRALEEARELADGALPGEQARLAAQTVYAASSSGRYRQAVQAADAAAEIVVKHGSPSLQMAFLNIAGSTRLFMADWPGARRDADAARKLGDRYGFGFIHALVDDADGLLYASTGDFQQSAVASRSAIMSPATADDPYCLSMAICHAGTALRRAGNRELAIDHYERAVEVARGTSARNAYLNASANLAFVGHEPFPRTVDRLGSIARNARNLDLLFIACKADFFAATLTYRTDMREDACRLLDNCIARQLELGHLNFLIQELALELGMTSEFLQRFSDPETTNTLLDLAARHWNGMHIIIAAQELNEVAGVAATKAALAHRSDAEIATVLAKATRSRYLEVRRVAGELRRSQRLSDSCSRPNVLGLTKREVQVMDLMAEGLTNEELAARLFISLPTVKTHVNHIFTKLGARDRVSAVLQFREAVRGSRSAVR